MENSSNNEEVKTGGRNLVILGAASTAIALATTGISLYLYHSSGDVYIDRSRPGYISEDEEEIIEPTEYDFSDTGTITEEVLEEYLENYDKIIESLDSYSSPFSDKALTDDTLGIPKE